jgi:hypothetical protein
MTKLKPMGLGVAAVVAAVALAGPAAAAVTPGSQAPQAGPHSTTSAAGTAADQDLNGDGRPDLLTVGGTPGLASGLWMAAGCSTRGRVGVPAVNLGINGNGGIGNGPSDFDGGQAITGKFTGQSFEDFLVYYPSGPNAGLGVILGGTGDGAPINPVNNEYSLSPGTFTDFNGDNPIQLANAYDSAGANLAYPDLFATIGDPTNGYTLDYYPNQDGPGGYYVPVPLTVPTPTGGTDWQNWKIYSKLLPSGTALALWNPTTGGLYLWEGVTFDPGTGALTFTQYTLAAAWHPVAAPSSLQLTDFNGDGVPDLWAVSAAGDVTPYAISKLSTTGPAKLKAGPTQYLS